MVFNQLTRGRRAAKELTVYAVRRMRRNRRVFLSRTPSIRRVLMLKDVVADGLLGKASGGQEFSDFNSSTDALPRQ